MDEDMTIKITQRAERIKEAVLVKENKRGSLPT
jgi:hypothetical protein